MQAEQQAEEYLKDAFRLAAEACTSGKYRHNRNPAVAGLMDADPAIRAGCAIAIVNLYSESGICTANTIPVLKLAEENERHSFVKLVLKRTLEVLIEGEESRHAE